MKPIKNRRQILKQYPIDISPFASRTKIKAKFNLQEIQNSDSDVVLARKRAFQSDEYIKYILSPEMNLAAYYRLSNLAKTMLQYIVHNCLEYNTPIFRLDINDFMILIKFKTKNKVYDCVNELITTDYIARTTTKEIYWINHNIFYKGNYLITKELKIRKTEEYLKKLGIK